MDQVVSLLTDNVDNLSDKVDPTASAPPIPSLIALPVLSLTVPPVPALTALHASNGGAAVLAQDPDQ